MAMYTEDPKINSTRYNGAVWVGMRTERINVILYHFRRVRNADDMRVCASRLTSPELLRLQKVVEDIDKKEPPATLDKRDDGSTESAPSIHRCSAPDLGVDLALTVRPAPCSSALHRRHRRHQALREAGRDTSFRHKEPRRYGD